MSKEDYSQYLRTYPIPWPVFSTKHYTKDEEGWYHPKPKKHRQKANHILIKQPQFQS